jgi:methylenetetrahydrofolate dehydrogenase (NADP+) / methenyltetrahydrofolate cyclohydrolase
MEAMVIKGDSVKERIFDEVRKEVAAMEALYHRVPGIAFIGFSCIPLARYNIPLHVGLAEAMGFKVRTEIEPEDVTEEDVFRLISELNADENIDAIVLLQPLPLHLNPVRVINRIDPSKEVEGFHPLNMLSTLVPDIQTANYPMCLPEALFEMFREAGMNIGKDKEWVFVLDDEFFSNTLTSMIVRTAASRVVPHEGSLTFLNKTSDKLIEHCRRADFLLIVSKTPEYIKPEWLKTGVCIIDIYSNLVKEVQSKHDPGKLVPVIRGGVNVESVRNVAAAILPIPGGLMTVVIAILFRNTVLAFKNRFKRTGNTGWEYKK